MQSEQIIMRAGLFTLLFTFLVAGCDAPGGKPDTTADPADQARAAIDDARARYQMTSDVGHAWRQPRVLIESAAQALEAGDYAAAIQHAERATAMAERSLAQAETEQTAWRQRAPFAP